MSTSPGEATTTEEHAAAPESWDAIAEVDPVLWEAMVAERRRQHDKVELIASENYVAGAVHIAGELARSSIAARTRPLESTAIRTCAPCRRRPA